MSKHLEKCAICTVLQQHGYIEGTDEYDALHTILEAEVEVYDAEMDALEDGVTLPDEETSTQMVVEVLDLLSSNDQRTLN